MEVVNFARLEKDRMTRWFKDTPSILKSSRILSLLRLSI